MCYDKHIRLNNFEVDLNYPNETKNIEDFPTQNRPGHMMESSPDHHMNGMGHMQHMNRKIPLNSSTGENELNIPPLLESDRENESDIYYTIEAQKGRTEIFTGTETATLGYNTSFLGPVLTMKKGQTAHVKLKIRIV